MNISRVVEIVGSRIVRVIREGMKDHGGACNGWKVRVDDEPLSGVVVRHASLKILRYLQSDRVTLRQKRTDRKWPRGRSQKTRHHSLEERR